MKRLMIVAAIALMPSMAFADTPAKPGAEPALTNAQCQEIAAGLSGLDGYTKVIKEKDGERAVIVPYKLGALRVTISQTISTLRSRNNATEDARKALIVEISGGAPILPDTPQWYKFMDEWKKVLARPCGVQIARIKIGDLKLGDGPDDNPIPPSVLSLIQPMLDP